MTVIELFGAPCAGKSTLAAGLFAYMKIKGYDVEVISECAKKHAVVKNKMTPRLQRKIIEEQIALESLYYPHNYKKVDYLITDSPLLLNVWYGQKRKLDTGEYIEEINTLSSGIRRCPVMLLSSHGFQSNGRYHSEKESKTYCEEITNYVQVMYSDPLILSRVPHTGSHFDDYVEIFSLSSEIEKHFRLQLEPDVV